MKFQSIRVLISMPEALKDQMDAQAEKEHRSRSELIREALRQYLEKG